ncbi:MAG TPA: PAS domain S-box protein [Polyangia bacterium]|nr:PAS domain S-box protein [Polyangia bacterium]
MSDPPGPRVAPGLTARILQGPRPWHYLIALGAPLGAAALQWLLLRYIHPSPYILFFIAVAFTSWLGGWGPALVCLLFSNALVDFLYFEPVFQGSFSRSDAYSLTAFTALSLFVTQLNVSLRRINERLEARDRERTLLLERERRTRLELEAGERRYRATFEQAAVGIAHLGLDGRWREVNARYCDILGYPRAELLQRGIEDILHPEDRQKDTDLVLDLLEGRRATFTAEERYRRKDGSFVWVSLTVSLVRTAHDEPDYFITVLEDIARRKEAEAGLQQLTEELERRVEDRTAALVAVNRELEAFSYSVSHDLRAPLRAIDGFSQVLVEDYAGQLGDEGRDYLERVRAASQRMSQLIDDLLRLSRVTRSELHRLPIDLTALARDALQELASREPGRQVETVVAEGLQAEADPHLVRVLIDNLLGNAWKFTRHTTAPRIEVGTLAPLTREPQPLVFYVRDNGAGFDMTYAEKLFKPFQRLHRANEFEGTGIGLAIVQRIVQRHGGRAWAEGAEGQGATFYFSLG